MVFHRSEPRASSPGNGQASSVGTDSRHERMLARSTQERELAHIRRDSMATRGTRAVWRGTRPPSSYPSLFMPNSETGDVRKVSFSPNSETGKRDPGG